MAILGLHVGVSFAEFSLLDSQSHQILATQCIYMPRLSLKTGLQKFVQAQLSLNAVDHKIEKVFFVSNLLEKMAPFRLGGSTAHLITEGWENQGWLSQITFNSMLPVRLPSVQSQDLVFGIKERISADGEILQAIDGHFIASIAAKMKLMDVKRVCIHFLHSQKNPAHLNAAKNILIENGFEVHSADYDSDFSLEKNRRLSLSAALNGTWEDYRQDLIAAVQTEDHTPEIFVLSNKGFQHLNDSKDAVEGLASLDHLWSFVPHENIVYLGLETFQQIYPKKNSLFWQSPWGRLYRPQCEKRVFSTQPTQSLQMNLWGELDFSMTPEGYEPGPVALGRGQKLTVFDLYFEELILRADLKDWLAPTAQTKIRSGLSALSKNSKNHIGETALQTQMRDQFVQRLSFEIDTTAGPLHFYGFWAELMASYFKGVKHPRSMAEMAARLGMGLDL